MRAGLIGNAPCFEAFVCRVSPLAISPNVRSDFACRVLLFCRKLSAEPGVARQIAWQLADAGTSVAANDEEAKGAYSRREFAAKNSEAKPLYDEANQLVGIFIATVRTLKSS